MKLDKSLKNKTRYRLFNVVGRLAAKPDADGVMTNPPAFRMKLFAANEVMARSRFWYFLHQYRKMKAATGEILDVNEIREKNPRIIKNYGIWLRYDSRTGTHNMYREYRDLTLNGAVDQMYDEMAGRHRVRPRSIQIIRTGEVAAADVKRDNTKQFIDAKIKFPLAHRIQRSTNKKVRSTFLANRPSTCFQ